MDVRSLADPKAAFEHGNGLGQVPLAQGQPANTAVRLATAEGVIDGLVKLERLIPQGEALGKRAQLGQASDQPAPGEYREQEPLKPLIAQLAGERGHVPLQDVDGLSIVAQGVVHLAEVEVRPRLERQFPKRHGNGVGALAGRQGAVIVAPYPEIVDHVDGGPPQAALVAQGLGEAFRVAQIVEEQPEFSERHQGLLQVKPEIDGLCQRVAVLGEVMQGHQRLLEGGHRLAVGRARQRPGPGLPAVGHGLVPHLAPEGMVRQPVDLLGEPLWRQPVEGFDNAGIEHAPSILEQTPIGNLVR